MSSQNPINNPTAYLGLRETYVGQVYIKDRDPRTRTPQDDYKGYYAGDRWINTDNETAWILIKKIYDMPTSTHHAVWVKFGGPGPGVMVWTEAPALIQDMEPNIGYYGTNVGGCIFTLPVACPVGVELAVVGVNGQWQISQNAGQQILLGDGRATTIGIGGNVRSTDQNDTIHLLCVVANTTFVRLSLGANLRYS